MNVATKLDTACRLGFLNIFRAVVYRLGVKLGLNPVRRLQVTAAVPPFFSAASRGAVPALEPEPSWRQFGLPMVLPMVKTGRPDWHRSVLTGADSDAALPWWQISDFVDGLGDIKGVWELSRFDWVLAFAQRAAAGDARALSQLNDWLADWCQQNPPYLGANWKCGQEASIRVMHLAMAALLLAQADKPVSGLVALLRVHLQRIAPTILYAIAQDNNHGTSEAAALYIGGSWLTSLGDTQGEKWQRVGLKWLENRARRLIESDGSFSQYSVNYHRVMLDTYSMAEVWRRAMNLPAFSAELMSRLQLATAWLGNMVSPDGADTPNLGSNDGARLLPLTDTDYRDVRPSVQLASVLFHGCRAYDAAGDYDLPLQCLGLATPEVVKDYRESRLYDNGGFAVLRGRDVTALLRYPRFRFRPGQCDLLHVDFWKGGVNLLRDAGSYSYNCEEPWQSYFKSMAAHNTIEFDSRDAMPKISRFLYGAWPKAREVMPLVERDGALSVAAGYSDWLGAFHHRTVALRESKLCVEDRYHGFAEKAVLRWRLAPGEWHWEGDWLVGGDEHSRVKLRVQGSVPIIRRELVEGWESRYYSQKTPLPVLEIEVAEAGTLTTELRF
ncbi:MAG: heparinase II/III family protein [Gammaproteobacteria bacterium]|nr:heparinase II/III family protein [Gammaproteobacteria bacterium]